MLFITVLSIFGCSKQNSDTAYNDLITNFKERNYNIIEEDVEKHILQGQQKRLTINEKENIYVYIYVWLYGNERGYRRENYKNSRGNNLVCKTF